MICFGLKLISVMKQCQNSSEVQYLQIKYSVENSAQGCRLINAPGNAVELTQNIIVQE